MFALYQPLLLSASIQKKPGEHPRALLRLTGCSKMLLCRKECFFLARNQELHITCLCDPQVSTVLLKEDFLRWLTRQRLIFTAGLCRIELFKTP